MSENQKKIIKNSTLAAFLTIFAGLSGYTINSTVNSAENNLLIQQHEMKISEMKNTNTDIRIIDYRLEGVERDIEEIKSDIKKILDKEK